MSEIREAIRYQRSLNRDDGRTINLTVFSDPVPTIVLESTQNGAGVAVVFVPGDKGADLISAMSSAYTAATQGLESILTVGDVKIASAKHDDEWVVMIRNRISAFEVDLEMMRFVVITTQILLNDAVGEYRRQISEIEKAMTQMQRSG